MLPELRSGIAAVALLGAMYLGTAPTLRAAPQQNTSDSNSERRSRPAVITAKPERVTLSERSGSTEIEWDTGNGSMGFVFVTEEGGKPALFANGSRGKQVARWIGQHTYVFELYRDDQRQTLLAKVTVPGSAERASSQHTVSSQAVARWALIIRLTAVMLLCSLPKLDWTGANDIPNRADDVVSDAPRWTKPIPWYRRVHLRRQRHFHSGLYVSILAPSSYAGRVEKITQPEKERAPSGLKEVLVLGDSRIAEGFSRYWRMSSVRALDSSLLLSPNPPPRLTHGITWFEK